jgi:hypothetical protein
MKNYCSMKKFYFLFLCLLANASYAQLTISSSFNPAGLSSLCALGYDTVLHKVWVYNCSGDSIHCFDTSGVKLGAVIAPGESANDVDVEIAPVAFTMAGTAIPQGTLLFINGETDSAEIYAIDPLSGLILDTLRTSFGNSHVVGGGYSHGTGSFFLVQDNVPGATLENMIGEVNPLSGAVIQTFQIGSLFSVSYGDLEVGENGNLYVASSVEDSILELTTQGQLVQMHDLPAGVSSVSGMDLNCGSAEVWVCSTNGTVYSMGASNCNISTGIADQELQKSISVFPNPSTGIFYFEHEMDLLGVFSVYGEMVLSANQHAKTIDLTKFSSGVYFLRTVDKGFVRLIKY